jgi:hypothetical protein
VLIFPAAVPPLELTRRRVAAALRNEAPLALIIPAAPRHRRHPLRFLATILPALGATVQPPGLVPLPLHATAPSAAPELRLILADQKRTQGGLPKAPLGSRKLAPRINLRARRRRLRGLGRAGEAFAQVGVNRLRARPIAPGRFARALVIGEVSHP